ncbi:MAG: hypothetical protein MSH49_06200 [[Eubacterium] saphenum]|nr:hypothetical protein [[Eubacterium] saphenum]
MLRTIALRGSQSIVRVFQHLKEISGKPELETRSSLTQSALKYVAGLEQNEAEKILKRASNYRIECEKDDLQIPTSIKFSIEVDEDDYDRVITYFKEIFNIKVVQIPFLLRIICSAYCMFLEEQNKQENKDFLSEDPKLTFSLSDFRELNEEEKLVEIYRILLELLKGEKNHG